MASQSTQTPAGGLVLEASLGVLVAQQMRCEDLECDDSSQTSALRLVNNAAPALAKLVRDAIVRDGLPNQSASILALRGLDAFTE